MCKDAGCPFSALREQGMWKPPAGIKCCEEIDTRGYRMTAVEQAECDRERSTTMTRTKAQVYSEIVTEARRIAPNAPSEQAAVNVFLANYPQGAKLYTEYNAAPNDAPEFEPDDDQPMDLFTAAAIERYPHLPEAEAVFKFSELPEASKVYQRMLATT